MGMMQDDRAIALLQAIEAQGGQLSPEQEREWDELCSDAESLAGAIYAYTLVLKWLESRKRVIEKNRKKAKATLGFLRAKMVERLEALEMKRVQDPERNVTVSYIKGKEGPGLGRVELAPGCGIDDVPPAYVDVVVTKSLNTEKVRRAIEAGAKDTGCRIVPTEATIRVAETARGKMGAIEMTLDPSRMMGLIRKDDDEAGE